MTVNAPAKLNLYIHITGRRADGYHLLESGVVFTEFGDTLTVTEAPELSLQVEGEFAGGAGDEANNLVLKAARALQAATHTQQGAALVLTKNIPVGAGLGGGSADAAATLRSLNQLWSLGLADEDLHRLAVPLGADVAMCLRSEPCIARGIGDELTPWPYALPPLAVLLVHPRVPLLTAPVFAELRKANGFTAHPANTVWGDLAQLSNDLEAPARVVSPHVDAVLDALHQLLPTPQLVRMTGSGACCYALYGTLAEAQAAATTLSQQQTGWWIGATTIRA